MYVPPVESVIVNEVNDPSTVQVSCAVSSSSASDRFSFARDLAGYSYRGTALSAAKVGISAFL
jgi:hypothetical protein